MSKKALYKFLEDLGIKSKSIIDAYVQVTYAPVINQPRPPIIVRKKKLVS